jgi:hypothetical protein
MASPEAINVGEIHLSARELLAYVVHAGEVAVVDGIDRSRAGGEGLLRQAGCGVGCAVDDALPHGGKGVVGHESLRFMLTCGGGRSL